MNPIITQKYLQSPVVLWSFKTSQYHGLQSYHKLNLYMLQQPSTLCLCENISDKDKCNLYFDLDWQMQDYNVDISFLKNHLLDKLKYYFDDLTTILFVKEASGDYTKRQTKTTPQKQFYKMSYHIIIHLKTFDGYTIYLRGRDQMKQLFQFLDLHPAFDIAAYNSFNLRLLGQDKYDSNRKVCHHRIMIKNQEHSTTDNDFDQYIGYCPEMKFIYLDEYVQKKFVVQSIRKFGYTKDYTLNQFKNDPNKPANWSLELTEQKCPEREHQNNNSLVLLFLNNNLSACPPHLTIKCMDEECNGSLTQWLDVKQFEIKIKDQKQIQKNQDRYQQQADQSKQNSQEQLQLTSNSIQNEILSRAAHTVDSILKMGPQGIEANGKPIQDLQDILGNQPCQFQGKDKNVQYFLKNKQRNFQISDELQQLLKDLIVEYNEDQLRQMNIVTNNIIQINLTQNINNYNQIQQEEDTSIESSDIPNNISENQQKYIRLIMKQRMKYITHLYNDIKPNDFLYMSNEKPGQNIYYFTNIINNKPTKGGYWTNEDGSRELRKRVSQELELYFDTIIEKSQDKKIKKLFEKVSKLVFSTIDKQSYMEQYAMESFKDTSIKFNQNKHLLHFTNGTYDLDEKEFVQTTKEMYNTQMIKYDYNPKQEYDFIEPIIQQIVGNEEYPWFIKQLANCLHPDCVIEQKQIVILTGQGNNGKTLIFNLMNNTMDTTAYGVNGRSIMLQASNEQMSNATPDLMLLKDKRFCNFAELDPKKSFNQQQVKQLTGGDMIQGRDLYDKFQEFEPYAGLFISCNRLPNIDTDDGGFLNRIKILELRNQFVENPEHQFHIQKDTKLLGKIKTKKWRQAFINLLIHNYYKNIVKIPQSIQYSIQSKVDLNLDPIEIWAEQHLIYEEGAYLIPEVGKDEYNEKTNSRISSDKYFQKQINQYVQKNPQKYINIQYKKTEKLTQEEKSRYGNALRVFKNLKLVQ